MPTMPKAKASKKKAAKRKRPRGLVFYLNAQEMAALKRLAAKHTEGNQSALLRLLLRNAPASLGK